MRFTSFTKLPLLAVSLLALSAIPAQAANCSAGTVTAFGLGTSTSCIGSFDGNDAQGDGSGALFGKLSTGVFAGITDWAFVGKSDAGAFDVTSGNSGTWSVDTALTGPFVLSLKASNSWSAYFFDGSSDPFSVLSGKWSTAGVSTNRKGIAQDLSHATIYRAVVKTPEEPTSVPEPSATAALGLVAIGTFAWLKHKQS
ncbi:MULTISPECIES: PEP-CTERM sorting domain-containing protein [Trichocoleus]|uniref:PEP-CTERM sorting domain-containing protein n=1 Tax=Trichocoleus desertorum GB2-A4 TaxID=2933944 RepID=A0ABV0JAQ2_9CYAN|nr:MULTISPECIES: PEP-CTERM sorting domain-containing protein [unclassified Trichocoleus]MBD1861435.1 PEP-CTERM sorting domain-containing protein [Trichocoleus sp. FACHB-46]MBD2123581.1 PEP-CTERM sorting domain-containing protein [Trichocoleus sp. FACHB-262]